MDTSFAYPLIQRIPRYTRRNAGEYRKVCRYIAETVQVHPGRYLVFFPSYGYLQQVKENYEQMYKPDEIIMGAEGGTPKLTAEQNLIVQLPSMKEQEKENKEESTEVSTEDLIDLSMELLPDHVNLPDTIDVATPGNASKLQNVNYGNTHIAVLTGSIPEIEGVTWETM